jgi:hypothetical protein
VNLAAYIFPSIDHKLNRIKFKITDEMKAEDLHSFCNRILESDRSIRFVGIRNKMSNQIVSSYRAGMTPLLTPEEIEMYAMQSVLRMNTRNAGWLLRVDWSNILGLNF